MDLLYVNSYLDTRYFSCQYIYNCHRKTGSIPVGPVTLEIVGVCLVQLDSVGKIRRNEVYFDRTGLLAEIAKLKQRNK